MFSMAFRPAVALVRMIDLLAQVDGDDVRALLGQPDRVAAALAAGRTGDERDLTLHSSCHDWFLSSPGPDV
jgi:hypothetical protein